MYKHFLEEEEVASQNHASPHPLAKQKKKDKLRERVRQQFVQGVSVAGLLEFYYAYNIVARLLWGFILVAAFWSVVYHSIVLIGLYKTQQISYDFLQTDAKVIPFPKVTACAPTGINRSWTTENLHLPDKKQRLFDQMDPASKEDFIDALTALLGRGFDYILEKGLTVNSRDYNTFHRIISHMHQHLPGGIERVYFTGAVPSCEQTVSGCQIDGRPFDCCENASVQVDHVGPCYDLQVRWPRQTVDMQLIIIV